MKEKSKKLLEAILSEIESGQHRELLRELDNSTVRSAVHKRMENAMKGSDKDFASNFSKYLSTKDKAEKLGYQTTADEVVAESSIREDLPPMEEREFGIPEEKKYPLYDKKHVESAAKLFGFVEPKNEEKLARAIVRQAEKLGVDLSFVQPDNRLFKHLPEKFKKELVKEAQEMGLDIGGK